MSSSMREVERGAPASADPPPEAADGGGGGGGLTLAWAAVLAAIGASLCCVGPLLFVGFGVGAGLASTFEPLRPLFTVLTILGLAAGFYTVYGRSHIVGAGDAACAPGEACARPGKRTRDRVILWSATVLAIVFWSFTYWSAILT